MLCGRISIRRILLFKVSIDSEVGYESARTETKKLS
jgi:hypothetical protein